MLRLLLSMLPAANVAAAGPFAAYVVDYAPAPGQFVNLPDYNDPGDALGPPVGEGIADGNNLTVVTLGGFGGSITLAFDKPVIDDPLNPFGLDAIVFGNAFWVGGNRNRHWAECGTIEISADANGNGLADDTWYLIPGSHIDDPVPQLHSVIWDSNISDNTYPPSRADWLPSGALGIWSTSAYLLPLQLFGANVVVNTPPAPNAESIWGYADYSPTLVLGDMNADNSVDDVGMTAEVFYTTPDDPFTIGVQPGSGGGDAFDIAWAVDAQTGEAAQLPSFDFIRITTAVQSLFGDLGEKSTEIDAVADVAPDYFGDLDGDYDIDFFDVAEALVCLGADGFGPCARLHRDGGGPASADDLREIMGRMTGPLEVGALP